MDNDNIKEVKPLIRLDVLSIECRKRKLCECYEPGYEVDYQNKLVSCKECNAIVDPFEALVKIARQHKRINEQHAAMVKERESIVGYNPRLKVIKNLAEKYTSYKQPLVPVCPRCENPFDLTELTRWCNRGFLENLLKNEED